MKLEEKKAIISDALVEHQGIEYIINKAAEVMNNPIFVIDSTIKVIAKSNNIQGDPELWATLEGDNGSRLEITRQVESAGIYEHLMHYDTPIFGSFDFSPHRMLGCRIRDKLKAVAYICVVEVNPICEDYEELVVFLCKILYFEMLYTGQTAMQQIPAYSILCDIIEKNEPENKLWNRIELIKLNFPERMRLLVLQYDKDRIGLSVYYIQKKLTEQLPYATILIYKERILILLSEEKWDLNILQDIEKYISPYPIRIGISFPFDTIMNLGNAYHQAVNAIRIGIQIDINNKVYIYENYALADLLEQAGQVVDLTAFIHPKVQALREYDEKHNTKLEMTYSKYLENGKSAGKTAKELFIHRSTIYSRLDKIEELLEPYADDGNELFLKISLYIDQFVLEH